MRRDEAHLPLDRRGGERFSESLVQLIQAPERPGRPGLFGDPRGVLEERATHRDEVREVIAVQQPQRKFAGFGLAHEARTVSYTTRAAVAMSSTRLNSAGL